MTASVADTRRNSFVQLMSTTALTFGDPPSMVSQPHTEASSNWSVPEGCVPFRLSDIEFVPWNNPKNIVHEKVEFYARKVMFVTLQVFFVIGGPANVINMAVFFKQGLKDRVNLLLFLLSLADALYLIMSIIASGDDYDMRLDTYRTARPVVKFMINNYISGLMAFCFVSFVLSAIIACERCYCVLRPLKYQTLMRTKTMAFIIAAVYATVLGLYFVVVIRYDMQCVYDLDTGAMTQRLSHSEFYNRHKDFVKNVDNVFFGVVLPIGMTTVVATATAITSSKLRQAVAWRTEKVSSISAKEVSLTKMLVGASILLIVCIFPSYMLRFTELFVPEMNTGRHHHNFYLTCLWVTQIPLYINSSCNIFIYYAMGSRYRDTLRELLRRQ